MIQRVIETTRANVQPNGADVRRNVADSSRIAGVESARRTNRNRRTTNVVTLRATVVHTRHVRRPTTSVAPAPDSPSVVPTESHLWIIVRVLDDWTERLSGAIKALQFIFRIEVIQKKLRYLAKIQVLTYDDALR